MESWKPVPFAPDYAVSDHGRVRRETAKIGTRAGKLLTPQARGKAGKYVGVDLRTAWGKRAAYVHRLVALAFVGPPPSRLHEVAHNDGNPQNNHVSNLRWALPVENCADKNVHGTMRRGRMVNGSKLSADDVLAIRAASGSGAEIAQRFGIAKSQVQRIRARQNWAWVE